MAFRRFRDWGVRELVTAWVVYWIAVILVAAFPQIRDFVLLQMSEEHGTVSFSYDGGLLRAALVLCGPPLALWAAWAATRPRRDAGVTPRPELAEPATDFARGADARQAEPRHPRPSGPA